MLQGASDLHWSSGETPVLRVHGELRRIEGGLIGSIEAFIQQVRECWPEHHQMLMEEDQEFDCAFNCDFDGTTGQIQQGRFRLHLYRHSRGIALAARVIPRVIPQLEALGLPQFVKTLTRHAGGLVLVTGPTGAGKSTTLAALIDRINRDQARHIITIEDPIEFLHSAGSGVVRQREVGKHSATFASALRAGLREDPDVIMVGELRDLETIHLALTAAETGHLVFSTLHASGAAQTIDRIIDVFPAQQQMQVRSMLAGNLKAVISQALLRSETGAQILNVEILTGTPAVKTLIRESKTHQLTGIMQVSKGAGMCTFEMHRQELGI